MIRKTFNEVEPVAKCIIVFDFSLGGGVGCVWMVCLVHLSIWKIFTACNRTCLKSSACLRKNNSFTNEKSHSPTAPKLFCGAYDPEKIV